MQWIMTNVVWYDGVDAFVTKFIVQAETDTEKIGTSNYWSVTKESERKIREYFDGNGEVLKIDPLYGVDFDNIVALGQCDEEYKKAEREAVERFKQMYF